MASKQKTVKNQPLPWLAPYVPKGTNYLFFHPDYLCKVSSYLELLQQDKISITLQALYHRVRVGTMPHVMVDGMPFIMLSHRLQDIRDRGKKALPMHIHADTVLSTFTMQGDAIPMPSVLTLTTDH